ncbi:MAG: sigma-54 interaction domain-containing protein [Leptospirales bacterium]
MTAFIGESQSVLRLLDLIGRVARTDSTLLITGESGTGKERIARMIHEKSPRVRQPFIPVNCGAIPEGLIESELFGHEKGAFTGAVSQRSGRFELAEGGTLFLDEIGELPLNLQVKLLRVLQEKVYERVGASHPRKANVRILAATHRNLERMVRESVFREDLFYRISVIPIEIPPLRERIEDIPILVRFFVDRWVEEVRGEMVRFTPEAMEALCRYSWPGNIRELENLVERFLVLKAGESVQQNDLPEKVLRQFAEPFPEKMVQTGPGAAESRAEHFLPEPPSLDGTGIDLPRFLLNLEEEMIRKALERFAGNKTRAAAFLGINRTTLIEKLKRFDGMPQNQH